MKLDAKTVRLYVVATVPAHAKVVLLFLDAPIVVGLVKVHVQVAAREVLPVQDVLTVRQPVPIPVKTNALPHVQVIARVNVPMAVQVAVNPHVQASVKVNAVKHAQKLVPTIVVTDVKMDARQVVLHRVLEVVQMIVLVIVLVPVQIVAIATAIRVVQDLVQTIANIIVRQPVQMTVPILVGDNANNTVKHIVLIHVREALGRRL